MGPEHVCPASPAPPPANNVRVLEGNSPSCRWEWVGSSERASKSLSMCNRLSVCDREWVSGSEGVWARVQTDVLHSDFLPRVQEWTENQIWLQSQGKVGGGMSQCYISDTDVSQLATNTNNEQLHTARDDINEFSVLQDTVPPFKRKLFIYTWKHLAGYL